MSNSDIISAISTLIVAFQYKSGSVDWRLVGQELGVDKDCARMRVQRLLKKWPSTDLDVVEDKIVHSNVAKSFNAAKPPQSSSPPQVAASSAGITKPRRNSLHYQDVPAHRRHVRANSLNTTSSSAVSHFTNQPVPAIYSCTREESLRPADSRESTEYLSFRPPLPHLPFPNQSVLATEQVPRVLPDNAYLCSNSSPPQQSSAPVGVPMADGMTTLQQVAAAALADERKLSMQSVKNESSSPELHNRAVSPGAAEGAVMLEKMKIDTILV